MLTSINGTLSRSVAGKKALQDLRRDIILGIYERGTKLTEQFVCEHCGISRTPARQIIHQLENEGLLVQLENGCKETIDFSIVDIESVYTLRNYYEISAVKKIYSNNKEGIAQIFRTIDRNIDYNALSTEEILEKDINFHRSVVAASGDRFLLKGYENIAPVLYTIFIIGAEIDRKAFIIDFNEEHSMLANCISSKPLSDCIAAFEQHHSFGKANAIGVYYSVFHSVHKQKLNFSEHISGGKSS